MGIFTIFRSSRNGHDTGLDGATEENNREETAKAELYVHIPTHAALDALSGSPMNWRQSDGEKIRAISLRRNSISQLRRSHGSAATSFVSIPGTPDMHGQVVPSIPVFPNDVDLLGMASLGSRRNSYFNDSRKSSRAPSYMESRHASGTASPIIGVATSDYNGSSRQEFSDSSDDSARHSAEYTTSPAIEHTFDPNDIFARFHNSSERKLGEAPVLADIEPPAPAVLAIRDLERPVGQRWMFKGKRGVVDGA